MDFDWLFPFLEAPEARHYDWNLHERFYAGQRTRVNNNKNSIKISFFISFTCFLGGKDTRTDHKLVSLRSENDVENKKIMLFVWGYLAITRYFVSPVRLREGRDHTR